MAGMCIAFRTHPNSGFVLRNVESPMQEATLRQRGPEEYVAWLSGLDIPSSRGPSFVFSRTCKRRTRRACCECTTMLRIGDASIVSVVTTRPAVCGDSLRRRETYQRRMMRLTYAMTRNPKRWLSKVPVSGTGTPLARVAGPRLATTIRTPKNAAVARNTLPYTTPSQKRSVTGAASGALDREVGPNRRWKEMQRTGARICSCQGMFWPLELRSTQKGGRPKVLWISGRRMRDNGLLFGGPARRRECARFRTNEAGESTMSVNRRKWCALSRRSAHNGALEVRVEALTNKGAHYGAGVVRSGSCASRGLTSTRGAKSDDISRKQRVRARCSVRRCALLVAAAHTAARRDGRYAHKNVDSTHQNVSSAQSARSKMCRNHGEKARASMNKILSRLGEMFMAVRMKRVRLAGVIPLLGRGGAFLVLAVAGLAAGSRACLADDPNEAKHRPNVVLIMADDK